ncbi:tetratricopeptide repeat protein [Streptomyces sp. NPDC014983]|uniref:tetratricopeptide repeat protein n=1 Tax=Streptomyces sp. NPDC014983 TaxID=3364933 RepID=UPI0036FE57EB
MKRRFRRDRASGSPASAAPSGAGLADAATEQPTSETAAISIEGDDNRVVGPGSSGNMLGDINVKVHLPAKVAPVDRPRPVPLWAAYQLNVHAAVPWNPPPHSADVFVLPTFVRRPHDDELRRRLGAIKTGGRAELVVVRGGSCVGKTRAAYEAVRECLADWQLLYPKSAQSLVLAHQAGLLADHTVLWLDNAHQLFFEPEGEQAAAAVRRLLENGRPSAVIATMWPEEYRLLTDHPAPVTNDDEQRTRPDPHRHTRDLLRASPPITIPDAFTEPEMAELRRLARLDPTLRVAFDSIAAPNEVTQTLAAGPELLDRWANATNPYGRAVLTAAIDARRLGMRSVLPAGFLRAAAPVYLSDQARTKCPEDWFDQAVAYGLEEVRAVASALRLVPRPGGMGAQPGVFDLADYLEEHAPWQRRGEVPAAPFWESALAHPGSGADLDRMGTQAFSKSRYRLAERLYLRAVELGCAPAVESLCHLYTETGHILVEAKRDRLIELARDAGDGGYSLWYVGTTLASIATEPGSDARLAPAAGEVLLEAIAAGHRDAVHAFEDLCGHQGVDATAFVRHIEQEQAAEPPSQPLSPEVAVMEAASHGDTESVAAFEELVAEGGRRFRVLVQYGATNQSFLTVGWSMRIRRTGGLQAFEILLRAVADTGAWHAVSDLAAYLYQTGRDDEAEQVLTNAWAQGSEDAWVMLCNHLFSSDFAKARSLVEHACQEHRGTSVVRVVKPLLGRRSELVRFAEETLQRLADDGDPQAQFELAQLLFFRWCDQSRNRTGEASCAGEVPAQINRLLEAALPHISQAYWLMGQISEARGDLPAAQGWYRGAVDRGDSESLPLLARVLHPLSDDAQQQVISMGLEADGTPSPPW